MEEPVADTPAARDWGGDIDCYVTNQTGGPITGVRVSHDWDGRTQPFSAERLEDGETHDFYVQTGQGGHDHWTVSFTDASGSGWHRKGKQCDITVDDFRSNRPVWITLGPGRRGFSVTMPVSSSCNDNYYDSGA